MKAWILKQVNEINYEETAMPQISRGEALVQVRAVGICGSDIPRIFRDGAHNMPLIPGHEFAGQVTEVEGEQEWLGKRVGVFPLIPCRECVSCRNGRYEMCNHYSYLGSRQDGGFAEYVRVPVSNLIELPENVAFEQAAMLEPMAVAVHAMRRVNPAQEDAVVVWGLGTIGMLLVMFLLERGIRNLYVIGNKDFQKKKALELGVRLDNFCDSRVEEVRAWVQNRTQGNGADIVFECIGKKDTIAQSIDLAAAGGSVCMVGNPQSDVVLPRDTYWRILRRQLRITGTWNSSFDISGGTDELSAEQNTDWKYVLQLLADQRIRPEQLISHHLRLEELMRGLAIMRDKSEDYLKIMICR